MISPVKWQTPVVEEPRTVQRDWGMWLNDVRNAINALLSGVTSAVASNALYAGPVAGAAVVPAWRTLGQADLAVAEVAQNYTLTGDTNNVAVNDTTTVLRVTQPDYNGGVPYYITGLTGGVAGRVLWIYNLPASGGYVGLAQDNAESTAANRVYAWKGASSTLLGGVWTRLWYDGAASRWTQTTGVT